MSFRISSLTRNRQFIPKEPLKLMFSRTEFKVLFQDTLVTFLWNGFGNQPMFILNKDQEHVSGNIKVDTNAHEELFSEFNLIKDTEYYFSENLQKNNDFDVDNNNNLVTIELIIISTTTNSCIKYEQTFNAHDNFMLYTFDKNVYKSI